MEKYKSFYPTLRQAKTKWSSKSIVSKQGEGPSHDWYEMLRKDAKAKLASSINTSKLGSISHQTRIVRPRVVEKYMPKKLGEDVVPFAKKGDLPVLPTTYISDPDHIKKAKSYIWNQNYTAWKERKKEERMKANEATDKLGKQTPSVEEIAKKHNISVDQVNAQIKKGIEVEKEHTADEGMANEIARDHLGEFPDYYDRLGAMEKAAKKSVKEEASAKVKAQLMGKYKMMKNDPPVPASKEVSPVALKGYERVKDGKFNVLRKLKEEILNEAKKAVAAVGSNTKGVLHELLVGYHMRGGKHMEKHPDVNGDSPKVAHDKLKASVHPDQYKAINSRAKAAAADLTKELAPHGKVHDVHWTSKPGDLHRSTGIHASQKQDPSDIVVTAKKGSTITHHGRSLKVSDEKGGELPVSNIGMEHTGEGAKVLANHRKALVKKHPGIARLTNKADRKEYLRASPGVKKSVGEMNSTVLGKITDATVKHLSGMKSHQLADHIRNNIIKATPTPMEKVGAGHTHGRHTTYGTSNHTFTHKQPSQDHEHILTDHKNIKFRKAGNSVVFSHKGVDFARHRIKFESQSDPLSIVKGSGELINNKRDQKKQIKEGAEKYNPDKEQLRNRIEAHKSLEQKMTKHHGSQSQQAAFHRALVQRWTKELGEDVEPIDEAAKKLTKKQTRKSWQAMAIRAKKSKNPNAIRDALRAHSKLRNEEVANGVGGGMSPVIGGEGNIHGTDPIMGKPIRRKKYAGKQVFVVDPTTYHKAYLGKKKFEHYEKYLEGSPMADEIREFARTNWDESIVIENEQTGAMVYLKYGSK